MLFHSELNLAIAKPELAQIERITVKLVRLQFQVLSQQPWFWRNWFERLSTSVVTWSDPQRAARLIREGRSALLRDDVAELRRVTIELHGLAPASEGSFQNVGIRRS